MNRTPRRVVILGGGFGGMYAATYLAAADLPPDSTEVTLISKTNYFTFTPLLAEVVAGALGREDVTVPYRAVARRYQFTFSQATVEGVDLDRGVVRTDAGPVPFDYLVIALGATPRYFGNERLARSTMPLTSVDHAFAIRNRVIRNAERAASERDAERRRKLLTFAVAGAGPAGVEVASEIWHLLTRILPRYYGVTEEPHVVIVEGGNRILPGWDAELAQQGLAELRRRGITVHLETRVQEYEDALVHAKGPDGELSVAADTLIWTAGTAPASAPLKETQLVTSRSGHVTVDRYLRTDERDNVFAVGDVAMRVDARTGKRYPPVAPIAISQGVRAAANIENAILRRSLEPYDAHHAGKIVSLGGGVALVDLLGWRVRGRLAWFIYRTTYLLKLVGTRNKVRAATSLLLNRVFGPDLTCEC